MTRLSVNVNKVATLRNARMADLPSVVGAARACLEAGAHGITVHPRPDQRHIRPSDVRELGVLLREFPGAELNLEGYPTVPFLELVREVSPAQCTLVPDAPEALTSDHGWDFAAAGRRLAPIVRGLRDLGIRVSLFIDADPDHATSAAGLGADRVELYTEPYARAYGTPARESVLGRYVETAEAADRIGTGVNAGHDLGLENLGAFCRAVPGLLEVSIAHALISRALEVGLGDAVREHLDVLGAPAGIPS